ncbi:hypothetical protein ACV07N_00305 [Roseivirga echinicomitans]
MKNIIYLLLITFAISVKAQNMGTTTLESIGVKGKAATIESVYYEFNANNGLHKAVIEIEKYDNNGNRVSLNRNELLTGNKFDYTYELDRKGALLVEKIANSATGLTVITKKCEYKNDLLISTTQVQDLISNVENFSYNDKGQLVGIEVLKNGNLIGNIYHERDEENRIIKIFQKLKDEETKRATSEFKYREEGDLEATDETRATENGTLSLITLYEKTTKRLVKETVKNLGNNHQTNVNKYYENDEKGSWVKSELLDDQFGRSSLVLRKITYSDGQITGRTEMLPEDDRAQYIRSSYDRFSVAVNGKVVPATNPMSISETNDFVTYVASLNTTIVLKLFLHNTNPTTWYEAVIVSHNPEDVFWYGNPTQPIVYQRGVVLHPYNTNGYKVGYSSINYISNLDKSFLAIAPMEAAGAGLKKADLMDDNIFWAMMTDSTYALILRGSGIRVRKQLKGLNGSRLINTNIGENGWYFLSDFESKYDDGKPGDFHVAEQLKEPLKQLKGYFPTVNFSRFVYDRLANGSHKLKTADGTVVTDISESFFLAPDNQVVTYFSLTGEYLRLDGYYDMPDDKDFLNQPITVLSKGSASIFYLYNENENIVNFVDGTKLTKSNFSAVKLFRDQEIYGAIVYDSIMGRSHGMQFDIKGTAQVGPLVYLPWNFTEAYIMKIEEEGWAIFEKGVRVKSDDFCLLDGNDVVYFHTNALGVVKAYHFIDFNALKIGEFILAEMVPDNDMPSLASKLKIDLSKLQEK